MARTGHRWTIQTSGGVCHLITPPCRLLHPALVLAAVRRRVSRQAEPPPRPAVLERLAPAR